MFLDLLASVLVRICNKIFHHLPQSFNLFIARRIGSVIYYLSGKRSRIAYSSMKASFGDRYTPRELRRIVKRIYTRMGETFMEVLTLTKADKAYAEKYVDIRNLSYMEEALREGRGMIMLSAHFGNWEMSTVGSVMAGFPLHLLARDQKMERLNELLNVIRESRGNTVVRKGYDAKNIFRILKSGGSVGILGDQNAGPSGKILPFFGRPASIAVGPYKFAQKTGAVILPAFIHRIKGPYHRVDIHEGMRIGRDEDITPYMEKYNRLLEEHITEHPEQWLWMHKKWKASPFKKILILDDGKKGHLKQSQAIAELLKEHRISKGYQEKDIEIKIIRVEYASAFKKAVLKLFSSKFTKKCQGRLGILKKTLTPDSYRRIVSNHSDVVVSTGSAMHPINRIMAIENNCYNLTVMDPGRFSRKYFDVIVAPSHDMDQEPGIYGKMVVTELAPNLTNKESIRELSLGGEPDNRSIGMLFGGDNKAFKFTESFTLSLSEVIGGLLDEGYKLRGTSSRRTGKRLEDILLSRFQESENCEYFVKASSEKDDKTVEKILANSRTVLVSGESISMVSEAVSSGKDVIVFLPPRKTKGVVKYEKFIENLKEKGYLSVAYDVKEIPVILKDLSKGSRKTPELRDNEILREVMGRLF